MTLAWILLLMAAIFVTIGVVVRVVPVLRRGRVVVLDRPGPCSMKDAQRALDRLIGAGIDAEIVEDEGTDINTFTNPGAGRGVGPGALYVIQVPRKQAAAAKLV